MANKVKTTEETKIEKVPAEKKEKGYIVNVAFYDLECSRFRLAKEKYESEDEARIKELLKLRLISEL